MTPRRGPRSAAGAFRAFRQDAAPATLLASVQAVWAEAVGPAIAAEAEPVSERNGVVTVACRTATWAQELDLMQETIVTRVNGAIGTGGGGPGAIAVSRLRPTADRTRFHS
jgi:predicted nucleic acid-binding Zn ribbon protein